jgi:dihydrofolate synthase/folylpolyglutamate synthase
MTHDEAISYWYGRTNYEHKAPIAGDFKLDRMRALVRLLGDPQERLRIIHVAGSKGKGSTSAMLASILHEAGYRVGLFTSPHLERVEERIQVNGAPISRQELTALLAEVRAACERGQLEPTFFEIATALGFLHFVRRRVDAAVVEVGLGGRLDSTNVCRPVVAAITSISHDHTQLLGSELASIAREKAGIAKPGRPVVSGVTVGEAKDAIVRVCREKQAPLWQLGEDFAYEYRPGRVTAEGVHPPRVCFHPWLEQAASPWFELGLLGEHQAANAAVAGVVVQRLRSSGLHISDEAVAAGLTRVRWPARLEVTGRRPLIVLDCAHNVASMMALVRTLETSFPSARRWLIFAASADKDLEGMFRVLTPHFHHAFLTAFHSASRSVPPARLAEVLQSVGKLSFSLWSHPPQALAAAREQADRDDMIVITGSVFLAGELRPLLSPGPVQG